MTRRQGALPQQAIRENEFQRQVIDLAVQRHWHLRSRDVPDDPDFVLPGIAYHPTLAKWSERGWPDLTMVRVRGIHRRLLFAELKTAKGKTTNRQEQVLALLRRLQGTWWHATEQDALTKASLTVEVYVWRPDDLAKIAEVLA